MAIRNKVAYIRKWLRHHWGNTEVLNRNQVCKWCKKKTLVEYKFCLLICEIGKEQISVKIPVVCWPANFSASHDCSDVHCLVARNIPLFPIWLYKSSKVSEPKLDRGKVNIALKVVYTKYLAKVKKKTILEHAVIAELQNFFAAFLPELHTSANTCGLFHEGWSLHMHTRLFM